MNSDVLDATRQPTAVDLFPAGTVGSDGNNRADPGSADRAGSTIGVFIVDDHQMVRDGVRALLESQPGISVVGEADRAETALGRCVVSEPDVVLLDVNLPDRSGIDVCRELNEVAPQIKCLMFSSYGDDEALFEAILAGASGYVLKNVANLQLVECIRRVANGDTLIDRSAAERLRSRALAGDADPRLSLLTNQERRVLELVATGLTNRQIAERLVLSDKTVKNYVSSVLMKLAVSRRSEAAALMAEAETRRRAWYTPAHVGSAVRF